MPLVVIQPSYGNADARQHWADTLDNEVPFTELPYVSHLAPDELAALSSMHPSGRARFWGATANQDRGMSRLQTGDVVLFTGGKVVRAIGEVGVSFRNASFGDAMWSPHRDRGSYNNVYSLLSFDADLDIPYSRIWALPGFNAGDNFMGLRFLDDAKGQTILEGLGISTRTEALNDAAAEQQLIDRLIGRTGKIIGKEATNKPTTSYSRKAGTTLVNRAEALLLDSYRDSLPDDSGTRLQTSYGGLADLYQDGPDGPEIIEAKSRATHHYVRAALSQLLDYALHSPAPVQVLGALFPAIPKQHSIDLLHHYGIDCIYFTDSGTFERLAAPVEKRDEMRRIWKA